MPAQLPQGPALSSIASLLHIMESKYDAGLMWFRRDLRAHDNAALFHSLKACRQVHCVFVFDRAILESLPRRDRRVEFIRESLVELDRELREWAGLPGAGLIVRHAVALDELPRLARELAVQAVFSNHDYEPQSLARDEAVRDMLQRHGIAFHSFKDQVIFERDEILTRAGTPYSVFTPYRTAWLAKLDAFYLKALPGAYPCRAIGRAATGTAQGGARSGQPGIRARRFAPHRHCNRRVRWPSAV